MIITGLYARTEGTTTWHWCRNCPDFPKQAPVEQSRWRPTQGEYCAECQKLIGAGACERKR
jgi:hypothetical protein